MAVEIKPLCVAEFLDDEIQSLFAASVYNPTPERMVKYTSRATAESSVSYVAYDGGSPAGIVVFENLGQSHFSVLTIYAEPRARRHGVGRRLIHHLVAAEGDPVIEAETDDDAVDFYHSLGFRIHSLGEKYPGVRRYRCVYDHGHWEPIDPGELTRRLESAGVECWVTGGWSIDMYLGRQTRTHHDTDVAVRRTDQIRARNLLSAWESFATHAPGLRLLRGQEYLESVPNTWHRRSNDDAWCLDMQYVDVDGDEWVYRRLPTIRGRLSEMGLRTPEGVPFLRPEIQLLYKAGGSSYRDVDTADLKQALPLLRDSEKEWLDKALRTEFPQGHAWMDLLRKAT